MVASTMVVHVAPRGKDMPGLVRYLYGPGKANEHTDQHAIAASNGLEFGYSGALSAAEASELGRVLEAAWHDQMAEANALVGAGRGGVSRSSLKAGSGTVTDGEKEHVYHLIVSLPPDSRWTDEQWATIARDMVEGMGFSEGTDDEQGCRWVAIRHGVSARGNDHLHIAVNLVRQDGRRMRLPKGDYTLANEVRRQIERRRDFVLPLHDAGRAPVRSLPAYTASEHAIAKDRGRAFPDRVVLQQIVRSAAATSTTEADWIAGVLDGRDVELEPARWAPGGRQTVVGYKVRLGEGAWFTGSQLAPDLTLPKMRAVWAGNETDTTRDEARALWCAEGDLPAPTPPARVSEHLDFAEEQLARWVETVRSTDHADKVAWRTITGEAAGVTVTLAHDDGSQRELLLAAGQTLSRQSLAIVDDRPANAPQTPLQGAASTQLAARHMQLALRAGGIESHPGWVAVLQQLRQVMDAIQSAHVARRELTAARQVARAGGAITEVQNRTLAQFGGRLEDAREAYRAQEGRLGHDSTQARTAVADGTYGSADRTPGPDLRRPRHRHR